MKKKVIEVTLICAYLAWGLVWAGGVAALAPTSDMGGKAVVRITRRDFMKWLAMAAGAAAVDPSSLIPVESADLVTISWNRLIDKFVEHPRALTLLEGRVALLHKSIQATRKLDKGDIPIYLIENLFRLIQSTARFDPVWLEAAKMGVPETPPISKKEVTQRMEVVINTLRATFKALEGRPVLHARLKSLMEDPVQFQIDPEIQELYDKVKKVKGKVDEALKRMREDYHEQDQRRAERREKERVGDFTLTSFPPQEALARLVAARTLGGAAELWVEWRDRDDLPISVLFWQEGSEKEHLFIRDAHRAALAKLVPAGRWPIKGQITRIIFKPHSSYTEVIFQIKEALAEAIFAPTTELSRAPSFVDASL